MLPTARIEPPLWHPLLEEAPPRSQPAEDPFPNALQIPSHQERKLDGLCMLRLRCECVLERGEQQIVCMVRFKNKASNV